MAREGLYSCPRVAVPYVGPFTAPIAFHFLTALYSILGLRRFYYYLIIFSLLSKIIQKGAKKCEIFLKKILEPEKKELSCFGGLLPPLSFSALSPLRNTSHPPFPFPLVFHIILSLHSAFAPLRSNIIYNQISSKRNLIVIKL